LKYCREVLPEFSTILRESFPETTALEGDVTDALRKLGRRSDRPSVSAVVSSLPIVWFPLADQRTIIEQSFELTSQQGRFLQLSYLPTSPLPMKKLGLKGTMIARIWRHSIPGMIWNYQRN
jgi:phospholipid N-methyltransferase